MKKSIPLVLSITLLALLLIAVPFVTASPSDFNFGSHLNAAQCRTDGAKKIIEVTQKVVNDQDSGVAGNAWAMDDYNRNIEVWQSADGSFCAIVKYEGHFTTIAGPSPGNTGTVDAGITGTFEGGYTSTVFTGILLTSPLYRTHGSIGTFDYQCTGNFNCPGRQDWTTFYFASTNGFDLAWWGWVYHAGNNGSWVNSIDGNSGDITGQP